MLQNPSTGLGCEAVALVDLDGGPVPPGERDLPVTCPPDDCPALHWPAWTDCLSVELGPPPARTASSRLAEALFDAVEHALADVEPFDLEPVASWADLPPLSGGAPAADEPPYEPTEADWLDYAAWSRDLDRRRAAESRYSPAGLQSVAAALRGYDLARTTGA